MQRPHLSSDQWTGGYRTVLQGFLAGFYIQPRRRARIGDFALANRSAGNTVRAPYAKTDR